MKAPFPWFGGKSRIATDIWAAIGADVPNYVEPFAGSLAALLLRPDGARGTETVNDLDGFVANFWRAAQADPEGVAREADWPVSEVDLHARHAWLVGQREDFTARLMGDPARYDVRIAGWWVWGICSWIGSGWCSGKGPWVVQDGALRKGDAGQGINRKRPHLGNAGRGINRQLPHLGDRHAFILDWMLRLQSRLRDVRVCCGDWSRVLGDSPTIKLGTTGILLDPPYGVDAGRVADLYAEDSHCVASEVAAWAFERGEDRRLRIVLCGYQGEHTPPAGWRAVEWKTKGGYGSQGDGRGRGNATRERLWSSPGCLDPSRQAGLFGAP